MKPVFNDSAQRPEAALIRIALGANWSHYTALEAIFTRQGITQSWNYYRDGKSWLCKCARAGKTVVWLSVWKGFCRLSFFFTQTTRQGVEQIGLHPERLAQFQAQQPAGKLIPLIIDINSPEAVDDAEKLIVYKLSKLK